MNTKIKAQRIYTQLLSVPLTAKRVSKIFMGIKSKDVLEAFSISMKKNFPNPEALGWELVTIYRGAKLVSNHVKSRNTFAKYVTDGVFRSKDNQVYKEEVDKFIDILDTFQVLYDENIIGSERIEGIDMFVLFPKNISTLKQSQHHQKMKALVSVIKEDWFIDWVEQVDLDS